MFTGEGGAGIIVGVGVGGGASLLQPLELVLDVVGPVGVLVLALFSGRVTWQVDAIFMPFSTSAAVAWGSVGVARSHTNTG